MGSDACLVRAGSWGVREGRVKEGVKGRVKRGGGVSMGSMYVWSCRLVPLLMTTGL